MANVTVGSGRVISPGTRCVIRDANDRVYIFVNNNGNIEAWKGDVTGEPTSFTEQEAAGAPNDSDYVGVTAEIDSAGLVHVLYYFNDSAAHGATPNLRYAQFRTSAHATTQDDWVLIDEEVDTLVNGDGGFAINELPVITIDANDEPHVAWTDHVTDMGSNFDNVFYNNRIGGSWNATSNLIVAFTATGDIVSALNIMIAQPTNSVGADRPIVSIAVNLVTGSGQINMYHGNALDATGWTSALDITGLTTVATNGTVDSITLAIDSNNDLWIVWVQTNGNLSIRSHVATEANWSTWGGFFVLDLTDNWIWPSIAIDGTDKYVMAEDSATNDLRLWKDTGSGWSEETGDADLPNVGTFLKPHLKWQAKNNNSPKEIDYCFEDSGGAVLYNTISVAGLALVKVEPEQLDLVEGAVAVVTGVQIADEHILITEAGDVSFAPDAFYHLDGDLLDSSGGGRNLTVASGSEAYGDGKVGGKAALFGGSNLTRLIASDEAFFDRERNQDFSCTAWVRKDALGVTDIILNKRNGVSEGWEFRVNVSNSLILTLEGLNANVKTWGATGRLFIAEIYTHVAFVWDGATENAKLYINGEDVTDAPTGTLDDSILNATPFSIGARTADGFRWNGEIDEVQFYKRKLTGEEIRQMATLAIVRATRTRVKDEVLQLQDARDIQFANLQARIKFDGDLLDSSGNNNNGTLQAGSENYISGKLGLGFDFNNSWIHFGEANFDKEHTQAFSISLWVKYDSASTNRMLVAKGNDGITPSSTPGYYLFWNNGGGGRILFRLVDDLDTIFGVATLGGTFLNGPTWRHIVAVYDGNSDRDGLHLYLDGIKAVDAGSLAISNTVLNNEQYTIGAESDGGRAAQTGVAMDDVHFYDRALTAEEVRQMFDKAIVHRGRVFEKGEILDLPEAANPLRFFVKVKDEILDLVEDSLKVLGMVKANPEILDLPEGTAKSRAMVRFGNGPEETSAEFNNSAEDVTTQDQHIHVMKITGLPAGGHATEIELENTNPSFAAIIKLCVYAGTVTEPTDKLHVNVGTTQINSQTKQFNTFDKDVLIPSNGILWVGFQNQSNSNRTFNGDITAAADLAERDTNEADNSFPNPWNGADFSQAIAFRLKFKGPTEVLDLVEGAIAIPKAALIKIKDEILDLVEDTVITRTLVRLKSEILDLVEGFVITRALIRLKAEILDLLEAANPLRAFSKVNPETLDLPEGSINILGIVKLKAEILDLVEDTALALGIVKEKGEILDLPEGTAFKKVVIQFGNEILDLVEGTVITRALVRLKAEILDLVEDANNVVAKIRVNPETLDLPEGSVAHRARVFIVDEILDIPETEFAILGIVRVSDETLDLVEGELSVLGLVKVDDEILDLAEARNFTRALIRLNPEILDLPEARNFAKEVIIVNPETLDLVEGSLAHRARVFVGSEILDIPEASLAHRARVFVKDEVLELVEDTIRIIGFPKIKDEILDLVEDAIALPVQAIIIKVNDEILDLVEGVIAAIPRVQLKPETLDLSEAANAQKGFVNLKNEILDLVESSNLVKGFVKLKDEILDLVEGTAQLKAMVKIATGPEITGPKFFDNSEAPNVANEEIWLMKITGLPPFGNLSEMEVESIINPTITTIRVCVYEGTTTDPTNLLHLNVGTSFLLKDVPLFIPFDRPILIPANGILWVGFQNQSNGARAFSGETGLSPGNAELDNQQVDNVFPNPWIGQNNSQAVTIRVKYRALNEILDLPESSVASKGRVFLKSEILDLVESTFAALGFTKLKAEVLDFVENTVRLRTRVILKSEILNLVEGSVITRALVRLKAEILDFAETAVRTLGFPKIAVEILDLVEQSNLTRAIVRLKSEVLELVEGTVFVRAIVRLKAEILDLSEATIFTRALVKLKAEILDLAESAVRVLGFPKIANEILNFVESIIKAVITPPTRTSIDGVGFVRGSTATGTPRGSDAIVLNRGTNARLLVDNQ